METHPGEGAMKKLFPNSMKPSHRWVRGEFWNFRGQHNRQGKKKSPQNRCLTTIASGEVGETYASTTIMQGLDREVPAASSSVLRVRTGLECPEDSVRELM